ncbi:transcriptional regulator [Metabacillus litoralis]|uniref:helix-turn-helix transcriptional regulator n=1 Tax=Metabacillus litoralis TaxID=152268 RepID=UPI00203D5B01|nr:PAS domain-containing protein [Metabacillus litoralis]MCM3653822.1 PAS domain-containing protein [Metabacillus litoralis]
MSFFDREVNPMLERYKPIADMIVATFGNYCEVTIHDLSDFQSSLIYVNGNVTGRKPGAPVTDVMLKELHKHGDQIKDMPGFTTRTIDGKILKASISFIRNEDGKVIGCIGINFDITALLSANQILHNLSMTPDIYGMEPVSEMYAKDIGEIFQHIIENTLEEVGTPIDQMRREDKLAFVKQLDDKGVFLINGAIDRISDTLKVSKQTIYNYLDEIRS